VNLYKTGVAAAASSMHTSHVRRSMLSLTMDDLELEGS